MARTAKRKSKTKGVKLPVVDGTIVYLNLIGSRITATSPEGKDLTKFISPNARRNAFDKGMNLQLVATKTGGYQFRQTDTTISNVTTETLSLDTQNIGGTVEEETMTHEEVIDFIKTSPLKRPMNLVIPDIKWKYLVRSVLRGENILMLGPSGTGKTLAAKCIQAVMNRPIYYFNLGSTQDPRASLIGNTHFNKETGTFFDQALFVSAIQEQNSIILLDELSRAHPDAWNILMTVLDKGQRYLRLDEKAGSPTINVAKGVTFIATANIGTEYTSTRTMDRALLDRFITVEMEYLDKDSESELLKHMFPNVEVDHVRIVTEIAQHTRDQVRTDDPKVNLAISTRMTVEMTSLLYDGFSLQEVADVCIYPFYPSTGGLESERTYMKQYVQKHIPVDVDSHNSFLNQSADVGVAF